MPRSRPQLSITLPRNFAFHYTEGGGPKTPENEIAVPIPRSPPRGGNAFRIKRRSRPAVASLFSDETVQEPTRCSDSPIPTIETPAIVEPRRPPFQQRATEPTDIYLNPSASTKCTTLPRTPTPQPRNPASTGWTAAIQQDIGESISRPMSACSLFSDTSDGSNDSSISFPGGDGSCTSPESDAADPFTLSPVKRTKGKQPTSLGRNPDTMQQGPPKKQPSIQWTSEMDRHLWSTYLVYLQDPTVTPFKTLPGVPPPLGVCHRVAREARRSWHGGKYSKSTQPGIAAVVPLDASNDTRATSPETIRANRSGSNTPTAPALSNKVHSWPKSGSSTRRRLRYLCKKKPTIAPHYQRLLQSRSPSPFSSPRGPHRSRSRLSEVSSPITQSSSFNTRDIQLSLTTSTAATMQPNGPLAQLATLPTPIPAPAPIDQTLSNDGPMTRSRSKAVNSEWFNEPPVPWASTPAIPSDIEKGNMQDEEDYNLQSPQLGSPFGYHTWGPSRSRQRTRPSTSRINSSDASTIGPSLRSPFRMQETLPYPGVQKRRARHPLEDEVSPGGSNIQQELLDNLFGQSNEGRHRRVRSRGFTVGSANASNPLESLFTPPSSTGEQETAVGGVTQHDLSSLGVPGTASQAPLGSPFHGISPRRSKTPSRHVASASLGNYEPFSSIGETLGQAQNAMGSRTNL